jgi:prepilin-type N-terminal cleavage/methylation domain-containing protein
LDVLAGGETMTDSRRRHHAINLCRGFTLVEIILVVGLLSLTISFVAVALASLWRVQDDVQRNLAQSVMVTRLMRQLRADAHAAQTANLFSASGGQNSGLRLLQREARIEYVREPRRVVRTTYQAEQPVHREVYWFGDTMTAAWEITATPRSRLMVTVSYFDPRSGDRAPPVRDEQLETVVGLVAGAGR